MRFWDASGIVPLLVRQARSREVQALLRRDPEAVVWWGTSIECWSALMRLARDGRLEANGLRQAERRLAELREGWHEVVPSEACRHTAERMLRVHPLRATDALQLAAALIASDHDPKRLEMVCLDERLSEACRREGFALSIQA